MEKTVYIRIWNGRYFIHAGNDTAIETESSDEIFRLTSLLKSLGVSCTIEERDRYVESPKPDYDVSDW